MSLTLRKISIQFEMDKQQRDLLYRPGNSAPYYVATWMGGSSRKTGHMHVWVIPFTVHLKLLQLLSFKQCGCLFLFLYSFYFMGFFLFSLFFSFFIFYHNIVNWLYPIQNKRLKKISIQSS